MRIVAVTGGAAEGAGALLEELEGRAELRRVPLEPERGSELHRTAAALLALEPRLGDLRPAAVLVSGEGVAALSAALAAAKLDMPLIRLGAGVRSGERREAEEINRTIADRVCDLLLCVDGAELDNLRREGLAEGAELVADPALDPAPAADAVLAWLDSYTSRA